MVRYAMSLMESFSMPELAMRQPKRTYRVTQAGCGFKLVGTEAVSISNGAFSFEGQPFTFDGTLGRESGNIKLVCNSFDLFGTLAQMPSPATGAKTTPTIDPLQVSSSGPLTVNIYGKLTDPAAEITYTSGPGSVEGHAFSGAELSATATMHQLDVKRLVVKSAQGNAGAAALIKFEPLSFDGQAAIDNFDIAVITPLLGVDAIASLSGALDADVVFSGTPDKPQASGTVELSNGQFHGKSIEHASARLSTAEDKVIIEQATVVTEGATLTASGSFGGGLKGLSA